VAVLDQDQAVGSAWVQDPALVKAAVVELAVDSFT
jgi:hypothetical protein